MAAIRETLILEDKFTSTMTQCLQVAQRMANMLDDVRASTMNVETAAAATAVQMQELAGKMTQTNSRGTSLLGTIRNLAGTFLGMQSVRWLVNTSDQLTSINARLRLMTGSAEAAAAAQEEIYQAAMRSRGAYADMADFVSQLGTVAGNAFTIAQIPGACVVSCENGNAYLLLNEGSELSLAATYKFLHSSGTSKSLDITAIANKQVLLCYSAAGNSGYGTSTILTASGNQIAGSFINGSQDAIALKSGTAGQSIEVIYSGTVAADWVTEGQVITSHGVYGAGVLAGVLQVWSKYMPRGHKMVTGIFIGRQASTSDLTNNIELGFRPQYIVVLSEASPNTRRIALPGLTYRWNANDISSNDGLTITDTGFLIANNTTNNNEKYHYVAFG